MGEVVSLTTQVSAGGFAGISGASARLGRTGLRWSRETTGGISGRTEEEGGFGETVLVINGLKQHLSTN
jgi:hypothetical protein